MIKKQMSIVGAEDLTEKVENNSQVFQMRVSRNLCGNQKSDVRFKVKLLKEVTLFQLIIPKVKCRINKVCIEFQGMLILKI